MRCEGCVSWYTEGEVAPFDNWCCLFGKHTAKAITQCQVVDGKTQKTKYVRPAQWNWDDVYPKAVRGEISISPKWESAPDRTTHAIVYTHAGWKNGLPTNARGNDTWVKIFATSDFQVLGYKWTGTEWGKVEDITRFREYLVPITLTVTK